ncbi:uncharacterized protein [Chironomus tepperi]|uniref:uncharacterized protein n=1 Tax=Chironomus tepperi TaxID=113505 RepID=UPI00391FBD24
MEERKMKQYLVFLCIFHVAYCITTSDINELNAAFSGTRLDSSMLQNYAKYIIQHNSSTSTNVDSMTFNTFSEISDLLKKYSTGDGVIQVQNLLQDVMIQIKAMIDILKAQGISEEKMMAVAFPVAYNDLIHMLSLNAHKLSLNIHVINLKKPENPKFKVAKPHKTIRKTYRKAFKKAFKEAKRLKVLTPRIMRSMPLQTSIVSDFQSIVTNLAYTVEKAFSSSPAHAAGAKDIILNLVNQSDKVLKILDGNNIKSGPVVFEIATTIFVDMVAELKHFIFAI